MTQVFPLPPNRALTLAEPPIMQGGWSPSPQDEPDEGISAAAFLALVRRHWLLMSAIFLLTIAGAYVVTRLTTPVYRASTTLYFSERQGSIPVIDLLGDINNGSGQVATEMEVMRSRALAEIVIDSLGKQLTVREPKGAVTSQYIRVLSVDPSAPKETFEFRRLQGGAFEVRSLESGVRIGSVNVGTPFQFGTATVVVLPSAEGSERFEVEIVPRASAVDVLLETLRVSRPNPNASVVHVSYRGHDPVDTKQVPGVLASTYLAWRSTLRKSGDRSTVEFLRRQIDTIATQLYTAEESLRRFRESNQVVDLPTQAQAEVQRLAALEAQRADIDMQRASLNRLIDEVKSAPPDARLGSPYRRLMAFPGLMTTSNPAFPLLQSLTTLEQRRIELLVRRTPNDPEVQSLTQAISDVERQIAAVVDTYVSGLNQQASALSASVSQFHGRVDQVPRREVEYARLARTATGLTEIYTMLQTRLREAQIAEAVDDGAVRVVDPAALPRIPIAPRPGVNLGLGAALGLLLGIIAIFLRERLDHTIHTKEEVESIAGAAVLALIPHIGEADRAKYFERWRSVRRNGSNGNGQHAVKGTDRLLLKDSQSVASEAFRKLRTNITFARPDSPPRVLIFTSPAPGDGKSTSIMNLAIALVQQGKRVIVLDADMRRGGLHRMLSGVQSPGLSEILVGQADLAATIQSLALESFGTVDLLPTGSMPPNPAELLTSPRFRELIETLRPLYDAILIDTPPVNLVTDAAIMGREADGAIIVARAAKTTGGELAHAIGQLRQVQVPLTGLVLNDYNAKRDSGYHAPSYYGYSYDYRPYARQT